MEILQGQNIKVTTDEKKYKIVFEQENLSVDEKDVEYG